MLGKHFFFHEICECFYVLSKTGKTYAQQAKFKVLYANNKFFSKQTTFVKIAHCNGLKKNITEIEFEPKIVLTFTPDTPGV